MESDVDGEYLEDVVSTKNKKQSFSSSSQPAKESDEAKNESMNWLAENFDDKSNRQEGIGCTQLI